MLLLLCVSTPFQSWEPTTVRLVARLQGRAGTRALASVPHIRLLHQGHTRTMTRTMPTSWWPSSVRVHRARMPANTALTLWLASADAAASHSVWGITCAPWGTEAALSTREPTPFATLLLRYRAAAHLTQEQLGARAGISSDTIAALERGKRRTPHAATVVLLADALGLEAQERAHLAAAVQASAGAPRGRPASAGADGVRDGGALRDTHRRPWWLTMEPTPLVGRAHELDTIVRTLVAEDIRLLTLTGPAGVGKTRLALAAAVRLVEDGDRFPHGVARVDLTPVRDPDLVP